MGERLRGIAENVFAYATDNAMLNERVMKLSQQVQHLSERTERLEPVIQREQEIRDERLMQEREHELFWNGSGSWMALRWDGD